MPDNQDPRDPLAAALPPWMALSLPTSASAGQPAVPAPWAAVAPAAPGFAPPEVAAKGSLGVREGYQFAEEPIPQKSQVTVLESPRVAVELPQIAKIDPSLDALKVAIEAQLASSPITPLVYAPPTATRWLLFSPFELFMEQVVAKKLWTLE